MTTHRATLRDVAAALGVSTATVSRAFRGDERIRAVVRERVARAAVEIGYLPNAIARSLVRKKTSTLGLIVADIRNPYYTELARGVEEVAGSQHHAVILCNSANDPGRELRGVVALLERRVDGVVITPTREAGAALQRLTKQAVPFALVDSGPRWRGPHRLVIDHRHGGYIATRHLIDQGYRRVVFINAPRQMPSSALLAAGYVKASREAGERPRIIYADLTLEGGYRATRAVLEKGAAPYGLFFASDIMAFGGLKALREHGKRVPEDVGVVGYDNLQVSELLSPALTSVDQKPYELGRQACTALLTPLRSGDPVAPTTLVLKPVLVVRSSSAPGGGVP